MSGDLLEAAADRLALAAILDSHGRHAEAEATLRQALSLLESVLGPDHYEVAMGLEDLAAMVARSGDPAAAGALHERARRIKKRLLGSERA